MIFSKLKSYTLYISAAVIGLLFTLLKIKSAKIERLKTDALETKVKTVERQRQQQIKTATKLDEVSKQSVKDMEKAVDRARAGRRDYFE